MPEGEKHPSRRRFLKYLLAGAVIAGVGGTAGYSILQQSRPRIFNFTMSNYTAAAVTGTIGQAITKENFATKHNLNITWQEFTDLNTMHNVFAAGGVDASLIVAVYAAAQMKIQGRPIKIIYGTNLPSNMVLVRADSPYNKIEDLKGKHVAAPAVPSPSFIVGAAAAKARGADISYKDFTVTPGPMNVITQQLATGQIDAAELYAPFTFIGQIQYKMRALLALNDAWRDFKGFDLPINGIGVQESFAEKQPEAVSNLISMYLDADKYVLANANILEEFLRTQLKITDPEVLTRTRDLTLNTMKINPWNDKAIESLNTFIQVMADAGALTSPAKDLFTNKYNPPEANQ